MPVVFSNASYAGTSAAQSVATGVDTSAGGLIWIKNSTIANNHALYDFPRGVNLRLSSNLMNPQTSTAPDGLSAFTASGFNIGGADSTINQTGSTYIAWSFRNFPGIFDSVAYTGNGTTQTIAHGLSAVPGMVIIKRYETGANTNWPVWHRSLTSGNYILLNSTAVQTSSSAVNMFGNNTITVDPTSSVVTVGSNAAVNASGIDYVMYVFSHDTSAAGVMQCGSYSGNGSASGPSVSLGWQPQFLLVKSATTTAASWTLVDGLTGTGFFYSPNNTNEAVAANFFSFTPTGFDVVSNDSQVNASGRTYIYMAVNSLAALADFIDSVRTDRIRVPPRMVGY